MKECFLIIQKNFQQNFHFGMKDTLVPLDIIFINEKGIVIQVSEGGEPLSEEAIVCSGQPIMAVLELLQNSGIKEGDLLN